MANEITASISFAVSKGGGTIATGSLSSTTTMSGTYMGGGIMQSIGTSNEAMDIPADVTGDVNIAIKNLDSTNFVGIYRDSGATPSQLMSKVKPGTAIYLTGVSHSALYAMADTAAVNIQFWVSQA